MKSFLKYTFLFALFAGVFYVFALLVWGIVMPEKIKSNLNYRIGSYGHMYTRLKEVNQYKDLDILFLGSSHAYRGFDTRIFQKEGLKTFNLGSSSQSPMQTKILLERHVNQLRPKLVVIDVSPLILSGDGVEAALDLIANGPVDKYCFEMALELGHPKVYNTLVFGMLSSFFSLHKNYTEPLQKGDDNYIQGGYVERRLDYYHPVQLPVKTIELNQELVNSLIDCLQLLSEKQIPVWLVYTPIAPSNFRRYIGNHLFDKQMGRLGMYDNFNNILSLNDSLYFYDADHLNQNGVELFNKRMIEVMKEHKLLEAN